MNQVSGLPVISSTTGKQKEFYIEKSTEKSILKQ